MRPIELPVEPVVPIAWAVFLRGAPLRPEQAIARVRQWLAPAEGELARLIREVYLDEGRIEVDVLPPDALPLPPADLLVAGGLGEEEVRRLAEATHVAVLRTTDVLVLPRVGLWAAWAAARALAFQGEGLLYDPDTQRFLPVANNAAALPAGGEVLIGEHIVIRGTVTGPGVQRLCTAGLGRFGLPELELADVPPEAAELVVPILLAAAQVLVDTVHEQASELDGQLVRLIAPGTLVLTPRQAARAMGMAEPDLPRERQAELGLRLQGGRIQLGAPERWPGDAWQWQAGIIEQILGPESSLHPVTAEHEWEDAHLHAVAELPAVRELFGEGLAEAEVLYVKRRFPVDAELGEFVWLEVLSWNEDTIDGCVASRPRRLGAIGRGDRVVIPTDEVFDWMILGPGGARRGGYTDDVLRRRAV